MYVYIDESGNTGKKSDDISQPIFSYMAIASINDIDKNNAFENIKTTLNLQEIHSVELLNNIEIIAKSSLPILKENKISFSTTFVEKEYLAYTKLYDTLFDNVENKGARYQTYQLRDNRIMMLCNLMYITKPEIAHNFYENCLFAKNENQAINVLKDTCSEILLSLEKSPLDSRSKEIISDALTWAKDNPKDITTFNTKKIDRWRHLPHIVGFYPLMDMISTYSKKNNTKIEKIVHDEQQQVKKILFEMYQIASNPKSIKIWDLFENGSFDFESVKNVSFDIKNSKDSNGLQLVDFCLYIFTHAKFYYSNRKSFPYTNEICNYISNNNQSFYFTTKNLYLEANLIYKKIMSRNFTLEEIERGIALVNKLEEDFKKQYNSKT